MTKKIKKTKKTSEIVDKTTNQTKKRAAKKRSCDLTKPSFRETMVKKGKKCDKNISK
jgi:hypothetical protein